LPDSSLQPFLSLPAGAPSSYIPPTSVDVPPVGDGPLERPPGVRAPPPPIPRDAFHGCPCVGFREDIFQNPSLIQFCRTPASSPSTVPGSFGAFWPYRPRQVRGQIGAFGLLSEPRVSLPAPSRPRPPFIGAHLRRIFFGASRLPLPRVLSFLLSFLFFLMGRVFPYGMFCLPSAL